MLLACGVAATLRRVCAGWELAGPGVLPPDSLPARRRACPVSRVLAAWPLCSPSVAEMAAFPSPCGQSQRGPGAWEGPASAWGLAGAAHLLAAGLAIPTSVLLSQLVPRL